MSTPTQASSSLSYQAPKMGTSGMLQQTFALLLDAYRELQSRRLFWISLVLSAVVVAAFGAVGFNATGFSIFGKHFQNDIINTTIIPIGELYKNLFITLGVDWWLSWIGIILALVSTAPMIPEFVSGGAVDLYLARPLGRARLFLTKYLAGLLFVALQVTVFCLASFIVIGIRSGSWVPGLFLAVPLVTLLFSYLWSICALIGLITRSTIAALMLTLLVWFTFFGLHAAESTLLFFTVGKQVEIRDLERQIVNQKNTIAQLTTRPATTQPGSFESKRLQMTETSLAATESRLAGSSSSTLETWHKALYAIKYPLPKTTETNALVSRAMKQRFHTAGSPTTPNEGEEEDKQVQVRGFLGSERLADQAAKEVAKIVSARTTWYVLGTSISFEIVILLLATWIFSRRDF